MRYTPSVRRRLVGSALRQLRENIGYDMDEAARILGRDHSTISRFETGERGIRPEELQLLLTEYGVEEEMAATLITLITPKNVDGWWADYRRILPAATLDWIVSESVAERVMVYAPIHVPELLRTPDYASAVLAADPTVPEDREQPLLRALLDHQEATIAERKLEMTFIIGEGALRQSVGGTNAFRMQLVRLAEFTGADYPNITVRILPYAVGSHAAGDSGGFSLLHFTENPIVGLVHVTGPLGGICLENAEAVGAYAKVFGHLQWFALTPQDSIRKLVQLAR
jgi:transcriptional regulator with XRE-family HTH domain